MALTQVNRRGPCFCNGNCPPNTRPWQRYFVQTTLAVPFFRYSLGLVFIIDSEMPAAKFCRWKPISPTPLFTTETLIKESVRIPADPHEYNWAVHIDNGLGASRDWFNFIDWDPDNAPFDPDVLPACGAQDVQLLQLGFPVPANKVNIRPLPEWVCTDDQARTWAAKYPLP